MTQGPPSLRLVLKPQSQFQPEPEGPHLSIPQGVRGLPLQTDSWDWTMGKMDVALHPEEPSGLERKRTWRDQAGLH
jgi:hypothetical protein